MQKTTGFTSHYRTLHSTVHHCMDTFMYIYLLIGQLIKTHYLYARIFFGSFEPIYTAGNSIQKMETIPDIFLRSSWAIFASIDLSVIADQIQICGWQHNYMLFLCHLPVPLPLAHQNASGKVLTVIRLLLNRGIFSEEKIFPLFHHSMFYVTSVAYETLPFMGYYIQVH